jgi:hypothetical protein
VMVQVTLKVSNQVKCVLSVLWLMNVFVPALENDVGDGTGYVKGIQSSEMCAICIMADAKDKSEMYSEVFA